MVTIDWENQGISYIGAETLSSGERAVEWE